MNAQRRRENALLKREGWVFVGEAFKSRRHFDEWIHCDYKGRKTRHEALRLIVSQAARAEAIWQTLCK